MQRPNILYIHSHDTGRYLQPYGYAVPTPNLQRLATEGVLFRQAFSAAPTCSPSRAALLTGRAPHSSGMMGLAHRGFALRDYSQHIIHTLREVGYTSTLIGMQHVAADPAVIGYDRVVNVPNSSVDMVAPAAVAFLSTQPAEPFFLDVGFDETHRPFHDPGPAEDPRYVRPPAAIPDTPETRADMAAYIASARVLDTGVGRALDALAASGLAENTLVISTTDHGLAFPGMKGGLLDHGIGVSLIMRGPGGFTDGAVIDGMVSHIDLFPTLCDLLDIPPPQWLQGTSFLPLVRGERAEGDEAIYAEVTYHAAYEPQRAVRTKRWKYIRRFGEQRGPVLPNVDDSPSKNIWLVHGWRERVLPSEQLYDLIFDPNEACNLAADPAYTTVRQEMANRLARWMFDTDDPLLRGPVPAPPGAVVNDPNGLSPSEPTHPTS